MRAHIMDTSDAFVVLCDLHPSGRSSCTRFSFYHNILPGAIRNTPGVAYHAVCHTRTTVSCTCCKPVWNGSTF